MEIQRNFLLVALFLVSFLLWNAWQKDYGVQATTTSSPTSDIATVNDVVSRSNVSVPSVGSLASTDKTSGKLVHVETPLLKVDIDTLGGNIIKVSLPAYSESLTNKNPIVLFNNDPNTLYVAQSGLTSKVGPDTTQQRANYTVSATEYTLAPGEDKLDVNLVWRNNSGLTVTKTFTFTKGSYVIDVSYKVDNSMNTPWNGYLYSQLKRKKSAQANQSIFKFNTYVGAAISSQDKPYEKISFEKMAESNISKETAGGWAAMLQQYFLSAWIPEPNQTYHYYTRASANDVYTVGMVSPELTVDSNKQLTTSARLYVGPAITDYLKTVAPNLDLTIDYGFLWFISTAIFWLMKQIHSLLGNWGWSIVVVTLIIKLLFYRLSAASYRSMAAMRNLQPRIVALKERYGDDRQKLSQATMELYRKEKINPLGGCLPILIQIPVFLALYWVLIESVQLRQAPFMLWIQDLSVKDPYYILPLIMGLTIFIQQRLNPPPPDPIQAKIMMILPFVFTVFFLNFPAGLVLYWVANNTLSIIQQWYIMRSIEHGEIQRKHKE